MEDVRCWLRNATLERYADKFQENGYDNMQILANIGADKEDIDELLEDCDVILKKGHAKHMRRCLTELSRGGRQLTLPKIEAKPTLPQPPKADAQAAAPISGGYPANPTELPAATGGDGAEAGGPVNEAVIAAEREGAGGGGAPPSPSQGPKTRGTMFGKAANMTGNLGKWRMGNGVATGMMGKLSSAKKGKDKDKAVPAPEPETDADLFGGIQTGLECGLTTDRE